MYALFWDCPELAVPADAWPYADQDSVDTEAAWETVYTAATLAIPAECVVCEDILEYEPEEVSGTECSASCTVGGLTVDWAESDLRTYDGFEESYTEGFTASIVVDGAPGSWGRVELAARFETYGGYYGHSGEGTWSGSWEGEIVPDWPADGAASAAFDTWGGDAGGWGWTYTSDDPDCPWRANYRQAYEVDQTWDVEVGAHRVGVLDDDAPQCRARLDGADAGRVECAGWEPYGDTEPGGCGGGGAAVVPLLFLRLLRRVPAR